MAKKGVTSITALISEAKTDPKAIEEAILKTKSSLGDVSNEEVILQDNERESETVAPLEVQQKVSSTVTSRYVKESYVNVRVKVDHHRLLKIYSSIEGINLDILVDIALQEFIEKRGIGSIDKKIKG